MQKYIINLSYWWICNFFSQNTENLQLAWLADSPTSYIYMPSCDFNGKPLISDNWRTILVNFRHFVGFSSFTESTFTNEFFFRTKSKLNGSFGDIKVLLVSRREVNDKKKRPKLEHWSWMTLINGKKCSSFLSTLAVKVILNLGSIKIWIMMKKETSLEYKP